IKGSYASIVIDANCDLQCVDYTLQDPFRINIDPIGRVLANLKDEIIFDSGIVKRVSLVKGRSGEELRSGFYVLDFISIELRQPAKYLVSRGKDELILEIGTDNGTALDTGEAPAEEEPAWEDRSEPVFEPEPEPLPESEPEPEPEPLPEKSQIDRFEPEPIPLDDVPRDEIFAGEGTVVTKIESADKVIPLPSQGSAAANVFPKPHKERLKYIIGEGDELEIFVWQHEELNKKVVVRPDGNISFPLVGDIRAAGLTPPELSSNVRESLSRLLKAPQVTVMVSDFSSKNIFVLGEVGKPGAYKFRGGVNILNAISDAGGWRDSAVLSSVMLVRKVFTDAPEVKRLNVWRLIKKGDFSQNADIRPGDIVYVPKNFVANIGAFIDNLKVNFSAFYDLEKGLN
ncbi:MAG: polysaccharide biosynthesis/export family protein, partial [Candidatus Omnitrophota bacterium]